MHITCACGHEYTVPLIPCPDGIEGCLVAHTRTEDYVCAECGKYNGIDLRKGVHEEIGPGLYNPRSLARLELCASNKDDRIPDIAIIGPDEEVVPPAVVVTPKDNGFVNLAYHSGK